MKHFFVKYPILFLALIFINAASSLLSQEKLNSFQEIGLNNYTFNRNATVIYADKEDYLWIGTPNGLFKYDGYDFKNFQYDVFDKSSIPNNTINSIVEDCNNNIWIGTESYLVQYNRVDNSFKRYLKDNYAELLTVTSGGKVWANLSKMGLVQIDASLPQQDTLQFKKISLYKDATPIKKDAVRALIEDSFQNIWIIADDDIYQVGKQNKLIPQNLNEHFLGIQNLSNNRFLAYTADALIIFGYDSQSKKLEKLSEYKPPLSKNQTINTLKIDQNTNLWLGTSNGLFKGVLKNTSIKFTHFKENKLLRGGLKNKRVKALEVDAYNNIWAGGEYGIDKYVDRNSIFEYHALTNGEIENTDFEVENFYIDKNDKLYVSVSNHGIFKVNKDNDLELLLPGSNWHSTISPTFDDQEVLVSLGNKLYQSSHLNDNTKISFNLIKTYDQDITDVITLNANEMWVGLWARRGVDIINTSAPISQFKKEIIRVLEKENVFVLFKDSKQNIWIGTRGSGLFKVNLNTEQLYHYKPDLEKNITSNAILSIAEDQNGKIWIGTRGGGLMRYDPSSDQFKAYNNLLGLLSKTISGICVDQSQNLWLSTPRGIVHFDPENEYFVNFGSEDNIKQTQFAFNSKFYNKKNKVAYFGTTAGYYSIDTKDFKKTNRLAKTVVTEFNTLSGLMEGDKNLSYKTFKSLNFEPGKTVEIPYQNNSIEFRFTSLDFTAPNKNKYAYKLNGINKYWIYTDASNRNVIYNDLEPGSYTFLVKSSNSDGIWNEMPATVSFQVNPPFYLGKLALLSYLILALALIYLAFKLMKRWYILKKSLVAETVSRQKDNEHHRMKMAFFTDISHELRTPLTLILTTIEQLKVKNKQEIASPKLQLLRSNVLRMSRLVNQIMDIRKYDVGAFKLSVAQGDLKNDILKIKKAFDDYAKLNNITLKLDCKYEQLNVWYDIEIVEKILFNLLSNAFKFTPQGGRISIYLDLIKTNGSGGFSEEIKCYVEDNGVGIAREELKYIFDRYYQATNIPKNQIPGTGIGMELVEKLVTCHHGKIEVDSKENSFTRFTFHLPVDKHAFKEFELRKHTEQKTSVIENSEYEFFTEFKEETQKTHSQNKENKTAILLVEDNQELRTAIRETLHDDFNVLEASNGKEGFQMAVEHNPHLIISDILMPVQDGISMLKDLKKNKDTATIPLFFLTARNDSDTRLNSMSIGADDFIEKPFSPEFLKWKVINTVARNNDIKNKFTRVIKPEPSEVVGASSDEKFVRKLINVIEKHIDESKLSVEFLASEVGMSRANLYRKLQIILNETPVNFIKQIRLKRAAQLLEEDNLYISEVGQMTGFKSQKYFSKCFKKHFDMSPSEYIQKFRKTKNPVRNVNSYIDTY